MIRIFVTQRSADGFAGGKGVPKRKSAVRFAGRAHYDERGLGIADGRFRVLRRDKLSPRFLEKLRKSGLVDGRHAAADGVHFLCINIYRDDLKTARGEGRGYRRAEFAQTNNRYCRDHAPPERGPKFNVRKCRQEACDQRNVRLCRWGDLQRDRLRRSAADLSIPAPPESVPLRARGLYLRPRMPNATSHTEGKESREQPGPDPTKT